MIRSASFWLDALDQVLDGNAQCSAQAPKSRDFHVTVALAKLVKGSFGDLVVVCEGKRIEGGIAPLF